MKTVQARTMLVALAAAAALPGVALADPPAVSPPAIPGPFLGAPTNTDPNAGQFSVNFDDQGRFESVGRADEHAAAFDLNTSRVRQARASAQAPGEQRAVDALFVSFRQRLREVASPQMADATQH